MPGIPDPAPNARLSPHPPAARPPHDFTLTRVVVFYLPRTPENGKANRETPAMGRASIRKRAGIAKPGLVTVAQSKGWA